MSSGIAGVSPKLESTRHGVSQISNSRLYARAVADILVGQQPRIFTSIAIRCSRFQVPYPILLLSRLSPSGYLQSDQAGHDAFSAFLPPSQKCNPERLLPVHRHSLHPTVDRASQRLPVTSARESSGSPWRIANLLVGIGCVPCSPCRCLGWLISFLGWSSYR